MLLLTFGCASSGPRYAELWPDVEPVTEGYGRVVIFRTRDSVQYMLRGARLKVNDVERGALQIGEFRFYNLRAGEHRLSTDMWDVSGSCHVNISLEAGQTLYFQVDPRRANFWSFAGPALAVDLLMESVSLSLATGLISGAAESYGKVCGGAFLLYPVDAESARQHLLELELGKGG
jgi:hypothetical protein